MFGKPPAPIPFTQEKFDALKKERNRLLILREEVSQRVKEAREMGDLSENGAYHYGKFELGSITRQLRTIQHQLQYGVVRVNTKTGKVDFGSTITLSLGEKRVTYVLVSQYESNPTEGKISIESPLGTALLGKSVGDQVEIEAPKGKLTYTILAIT